MNALQSNLARSLQAKGVTVPPTTTGLTRLQDDMLVRMFMHEPGLPLRGGYGPDDVSATTGNSLVGRGLAMAAKRPAGGKRGAYFLLTEAGRDRARTVRTKQWAGGR